MEMYCVLNIAQLLNNWEPDFGKSDLGLSAYLEFVTGFVADPGTAEEVFKQFVAERVA